jgi:hypothetical protein
MKLGPHIYIYIKISPLILFYLRLQYFLYTKHKKVQTHKAAS